MKPGTNVISTLNLPTQGEFKIQANDEKCIQLLLIRLPGSHFRSNFPESIGKVTVDDNIFHVKYYTAVDGLEHPGAQLLTREEAETGQSFLFLPRVAQNGAIICSYQMHESLIRMDC